MAKNVLPVGCCPDNPEHPVFRAQQIAANGTPQIFDWCPVCEKIVRHGSILWIGKDIAGEIENLPIMSDYRPQNPPCAVCGGSGTELHHWAPRNIFGDEADRWPMTWLCRQHHVEWHEQMDGYKRYGRHRD